MPAFQTITDFERRLDALGLFHMDLRLERMRRVLDAMPPWRSAAVVQVVGTNGKGSTSVFLACLAQAAGRRAGLFTSPHLKHVSERILLLLPGQPAARIPEAGWLEEANAVMAAGGDCLTYFELLTILATRLFARSGVEAAVFEAGLGGSHDATSSLEKDLLCICPIDLDHRAQLGHTPAAVARDKAGAMRPGVPTLSAPQRPDVAQVLEDAAERCPAPLDYAPPVPEGATLGLPGAHQRINAGLAVAAWRSLAAAHGWRADQNAIAAGLRQAWLPARLHHIPARPPSRPALIVDGGHNPHGLQALAAFLDQQPRRPAAAIFACMEDKDLDALLPLAAQIAANRPLLLPPLPNNHRAMPPEALARRLRGLGANARPVPSLADALLQAAAVGQTLIFGSLYLAGEFYTLYPECLAPLGAE